jgi:hypothetical protein
MDLACWHERNRAETALAVARFEVRSAAYRLARADARDWWHCCGALERALTLACEAGAL